MAYRCGGFSSWYGPCGASDCLSCHPRGYDYDDDDDDDGPEICGIHRTTVQTAAKDYPSVLPQYSIAKGQRYRKTVIRYYTNGGPWGAWSIVRRPIKD